MCGQSYLPDVISALCGELSYYWIMTYLTKEGGEKTWLWERKVNTCWKPLLWFVKGTYSGDRISDMVDSPENDKRFHEWGQSVGGMAEIVERITDPGDVVLDPFLGGGTTGVAAVMQSRKFIGSDIKQENIETSKKRILLSYGERENRL